MSTTIKKLYDFIDHGKKLGKYPQSTAQGIVAALRVVEQGLLPDEPDDLKYITDHLAEIYHRQSNKLSLSAASIETYIGRLKRVVSDYQKYGSDPKAMLSWKPRIVQRGPRTRPKETPVEVEQPSSPAGVGMSPLPVSPGGQLKTLVWSLRPDLNIQIQLPRDLNQKDVDRLAKQLKLEAELSE